MPQLDFPARSERLLIRLRPRELERATKLATAEEVKIPELVRRLLAKAWRETAQPLFAGEEQQDGQDQ
jgi:hypothetical protein